MNAEDQTAARRKLSAVMMDLVLWKTPPNAVNSIAGENAFFYIT